MYSVIIVDDEKFVRKGLQGLIDWEKNGFRVMGEADDGDDALAMIRDMKPDLAITDIRMPVMDGIELIQAASALELETEFIIISGYNDFRYAQQALRHGAMDYVLKPIDKEDIEQALSKLSRKLDEKRLQRERRLTEIGEKQIEALIRGALNGAELADWAKPWESAGAQLYTYVLIELNQPLLEHNDVAPSRRIVKDMIREALDHLIPVSQAPVVYEHRKAYGLVVPDLYWINRQPGIREFLRAVLRRLAERSGLDFRAYAGIPVQSLEQLSRSYSSAKDAVAYKFVRHQDPVILHADVSTVKLNYRHLSGDAHRCLMEAVENNNPEAMHQAIETVFAEFQHFHFSPEAVKTAIVQCVLEIGKRIQILDGDEKELAHMEQILNWHDRNVTWEHLKQLVSAFMSEAADLIGHLYRTSTMGPIYKVKLYVDENYRQNINLKSIAAQFYMNTAYLGQLFKKTFGVYFNDYLLRLRIDEAKRLLRQSDMRIYEIADRVGFSKADYFVTQFEKLENMTPTEFRNLRK